MTSWYESYYVRGGWPGRYLWTAHCVFLASQLTQGPLRRNDSKQYGLADRTMGVVPVFFELSSSNQHNLLWCRIGTFTHCPFFHMYSRAAVGLPEPANPLLLCIKPGGRENLARLLLAGSVSRLAKATVVARAYFQLWVGEKPGASFFFFPFLFYAWCWIAAPGLRGGNH